MTRDEILHLLFEAEAKELFARADAVRRASKGDHVFVRGLVEFSNHCVRDCHYCGLRRSNTSISRYRLGHDEIMLAARQAVEAGVDTIVLQSGDDYGQDPRELARTIETIRTELGVAVTLGTGERSMQEYALWHSAGATRFLMKHETADTSLYAKLHPGRTLKQRTDTLRSLRELGYEIGSGFIVGLPGQRPDSLADDVLLVRELGVEMCGAGPFVPQADTPLGNQPRGSVDLALRVMAVLRIALPDANLPATTALATLDPVAGQRDGLKAGGNVLMPSFTPDTRRAQYRIYDNKTRVGIPEACDAIEAAGRSHSLRQEHKPCRMHPKGCDSI